MNSILQRFWPWRKFIVGASTIFTFLIFWRLSSSSQSRFTAITSQVWVQSPILREIDNATFGFERIYAVNLPARKDRRDALSLAAVLSGLRIDFVDGVLGTDVAEETLPAGARAHHLRVGVIGSWRAHLDALYQIVKNNITTALIIEDDVDWDIRIRSQLRDFARASHILTQPLRQSGGFLDPSLLDPSQTRGYTELVPAQENLIQQPKISPYGDFWDVLWLGHCGARFPDYESDPQLPRGRVIIGDDATVVAPHHFDKDWGSDEIIRQYPEHTRIVHHTAENVCTLAYAVTQQSARRILYELGQKYLDDPFDLMLRHLCDGNRPNSKPHRCLTIQPQLMNHHRPRGNSSTWSTINEWREPKTGEFKINEDPYTLNVRWSTMVNIERMLDGDADYIDSYPD